MNRWLAARLHLASIALFVAIVGGAACASTPPPRQGQRVVAPDTGVLPIVVRHTDRPGISGVVRDHDVNGPPIVSVQVGVPGMNIEALTDAHGRFSMQLAPGSYKLLTKRIGYHVRTDSIQVPSEGGLSLVISLREYPLRLDGSCHRIASGDVIC